MTVRTASISVAALVVVFAAAPPVAAQGEATPADDEEIGDLGTITVTARKREESVMNAQAAVAVVESSDIAGRGLESFEDYLDGVPGVSYREVAPGNNRIVLRGLDHGSSFVSFGASVYFDEVPLTLPTLRSFRAVSVDLKLVDIDRVEVLRGPQGTLYGINSMAGIVRMSPARPDLTRKLASASAKWMTIADGSDAFGYHGMMNMPFEGSDVGLRLVGYRVARPGYLDGVNTGVIDGDDAAAEGGRAAVRWSPDSDRTIDLMLVHQEETGHGPFLAQRSRGLDSPSEAFFEVRERAHDRVSIAGLVYNQRLRVADLTIAGSIIERNGWAEYHSGFPVPVSERYGPSVGRAFETRLRGGENGPWNWLAGLWAFDHQLDSGQRILDVDDSGFCSAFGAPTPCDALDTRFESTMSELGVFGEIERELGSGWALQAGGRWFELEERTRTRGDGLLLMREESFRSDSANFDPMLGVSWSPDESGIFYAKVERGHQPGFSYGDAPSAVCDDDRPGNVDPSYSTSAEIGAKRDFEARHRVEVALYRLEWTDLQLQVVPPPPCSFPYHVNLGEARIEGAEIIYRGRPWVGWELQTALAYNRGNLVEDIPGLGEAGDDLPNQPDWQVHAGITRAFGLGNATSTVRVDATYVGQSENGIGGTVGGQFPSSRQGGYVKLDARWALEWANGWTISAFVRNATDRRVIDSAVFGDLGQMLRPRTVGFRLAYAY